MDEVGVDALNLIEQNAPFLEDLPKDLIPGTCIGLKALIKPDCYRYVEL